MQFNLRADANWNMYSKIKNNEIKGFHYISKNYKEKGIITYCSGVPPFGIFYNVSFKYINVEVNPSIILNHYPFADDYITIEEACKKVIFENIGIPQYYISSITLHRIDYNVDYRISSEEEKDIIYNLMSKTRENLGRVVKTTFKSAITYLPDSSYVEVITYDKEMEQILQYKYEDYEYVENLEKFKGVFRTEVRIKNRKLNQNKRSDIWALSKDLSNYLCEDMKKYYWKKYAEKIWFEEPFYRLDVAIKIVKQSDTLTENTKLKIIEVLKRINRSGYTKARNYYAYLKRERQVGSAKDRGSTEAEIKAMENKKLSSQDFSTFNNYIKKIRQLGINPLTFDKKFGLEKIKNFAKYESSAVDD